jgi:AcrR family transcriptional regulator
MRGGSASSGRQHTEGLFRLSTIAHRPLRADARRNREKILAAAASAFGESGLECQVEDIARRAGVGVGTVYRHFPTKDVLVTALSEAHFERLADIVEAALDGDGDPWEVFAAAIWHAAEPATADVAWCEIVAGRATAIGGALRGQQRLATATAALIERAQAAGRMRADATVQDVRAIMCALGHVATAQRAGAPLDWRRYLEIALDGLRAH